MSAKEFYLRYYVGHLGKFGHEFLEFEVNSNGLIRYANNSNYRRDSLIKKRFRVCQELITEIIRIVEESEIIKEDDSKWPEKNDSGKQEIEIKMGKEHISFETSKISSLVEIQDSKDPEGLRCLYYLVQDLKCLIFSLITLHFKIRPIG